MLRPIITCHSLNERDSSIRIVLLEEIPDNVFREFLQRIQTRFADKLSSIELTDKIILHFKNQMIAEDVIDDLDTFVGNIIGTLRHQFYPAAA